MTFLNNFSERNVPDTRLRSIQNNLENILGTKKGYGALPILFGLDEHDFYNSTETNQIILQQIEENIEQYEPNIQNLKIKKIKDKGSIFSLSFQVTGTVNSSELYQAEFDLTLGKILNIINTSTTV